MLTSTAKSEPSQLTAIWLIGDGIGTFLVGTFLSTAPGDSKSFMHTTTSSGMLEPRKTSPTLLADATRLTLAFCRLFPLKIEHLLVKRKEMC